MLFKFSSINSNKRKKLIKLECATTIQIARKNIAAINIDYIAANQHLATLVMVKKDGTKVAVQIVNALRSAAILATAYARITTADLKVLALLLLLG